MKIHERTIFLFEKETNSRHDSLSAIVAIRCLHLRYRQLLL